MTKTEKVAGAKMNCFDCKTLLTCVSVPAQGNYPAKLQWHDENGSHYGWDQKLQKAYCKTQKPKIEKAERAGESVQATNEIHLKDLKIDLEDLTRLQEETEKILSWQLARIYYIQEGLKARGITPTGPFVGMLFNQLMETLRS